MSLNMLTTLCWSVLSSELGILIGVVKTEALDLMKDGSKNCHYDTKPIKTNSAINKIENLRMISQKTFEEVNAILERIDAIKINSNHKLAESDIPKN